MKNNNRLTTPLLFLGICTLLLTVSVQAQSPQDGARLEDPRAQELEMQMMEENVEDPGLVPIQEVSPEFIPEEIPQEEPPQEEKSENDTDGEMPLEETLEEDMPSDASDNNIIEIPYGVQMQEFKEAIKPAPEATFEVYESDQMTVAQELQDGQWLVVTAGDGETQAFYEISFLPNIDATISTQLGNVDPKHTILANIPYGTTVEELKSQIVPADQATFEIYEKDGQTIATELKEGFIVKVTAGDQKNKRTYQIRILPNTDAKVTATLGEVNHEEGKIANIPYGTQIEDFKSQLTVAPEAKYEIYKVNGRDVATTIAENYRLVVTAGDNQTQKSYILSFAPNTETTVKVLLEDLWKKVRQRYEIGQ